MPSRSKPDQDNRRRFPRAGLKVKTLLSEGAGKTKSFEATLHSRDISVGGVFLESTFGLKLGQKLNVEFKVPPKDRMVQARGTVVRVESAQGQRRGAPGFAIRFDEYVGSSRVALANYFLGPELKEFVQKYARENHLKHSDADVEQWVDMLAAWEVVRAEKSSPLWGGPG